MYRTGYDTRAIHPSRDWPFSFVVSSKRTSSLRVDALWPIFNDHCMPINMDILQVGPYPWTAPSYSWNTVHRAVQQAHTSELESRMDRLPLASGAGHRDPLGDESRLRFCHPYATTRASGYFQLQPLVVPLGPGIKVLSYKEDVPRYRASPQRQAWVL